MEGKMTEAWHLQLKEARDELAEATEHYNTQIDLFKSGATSKLETERAYHQKQQAHENERKVFHQVFPRS